MTDNYIANNYLKKIYPDPIASIEIPMNEYEERVEILLKKQDKLTEIYKTEIKNCFKYLDEEFRKYRKKAGKIKKLKIVSEVGGAFLILLGSSSAIALSFIPLIPPIFPIVIGLVADAPSLISILLTKIGFDRIRKKQLDKAYYAKEFKDRLYHLYSKIMEDGKITEEEYESFSRLMETYHEKKKSNEKDSKDSSILTDKDYKEIDTLVKEKLKQLSVEQKLKKLKSYI